MTAEELKALVAEYAEAVQSAAFSEDQGTGNDLEFWEGEMDRLKPIVMAAIDELAAGTGGPKDRPMDNQDARSVLDTLKEERVVSFKIIKSEASGEPVALVQEECDGYYNEELSHGGILRLIEELKGLAWKMTSASPYEDA